EPKSVAFTPYRICPIGAHSDHQLGKITGFAIDKGIYITYADTSALEADLGFKPSTSLRMGLRKFAEWYKEYYRI
ncbi:MAG: hypothetical protein MJ101_06350, partial [Clostridia bacterium]|nr:hypothetical protein [Clostridia bacterium]